MTEGVIRNPQDWIRDPRIAEVARASGWASETGDLSLLAAIMAIESSGDTLARSGSDGCVGLVQFHRGNNHGLFDRSHWNDNIGAVFRRFNIERPALGADESVWFNEPRSSVIYAGFVLQDQFGQLSGSRRGNLLLALQGYNGGTNDLRNPGAVNSEAREYPERIAAYLDYQANHGATEEIRSSSRRTLDRLLADAAEVGQRDRIVAGITQYGPSMRNRERAMNALARGEDVPIRYTRYQGNVTPGTYLAGLADGSETQTETETETQDGQESQTPQGRFNLWQALAWVLMLPIQGIAGLFRFFSGNRSEEPAAEAPATSYEQEILDAFNRTDGVAVTIQQNPEAARALQEALGARQDGIIGDRTRNKLEGSSVDAEGEHEGVLELGELRAIYPRVDTVSERAIS